jgi:uncharacterized protein (TIGR02266 family)
MTLAKKKILLAVDSDTLPQLESIFANRDKFDVTLTGNGREACRIMREQQPDLVLMDIFLPGMNGDESCYSVKKDNACPNTHIVLIAYAGRAENQERCRRACCDELLNKPLDSEQLSALVYNFLYANMILPRYKSRIAIYYGAEQQELLAHYAVNLSTGGLFIETNIVFSVDAPLTVEFMLPSSNAHITCKARVAWINEPGSLSKPFLSPGIGLQFLDLSLKDMHAIRDFINKGDLTPTW